MTRRLQMTVLLVMMTAGCSNDPDGTEPVMIITVEDDADHSAADDADMSTQIDDHPDLGTTVDEGNPETTPDMSMPDTAGPSGTACQMKDAPVQLINTCTFEWSSCADGVQYAFQCNIQNVAGNVFSLCNCFENGVKDEADKIVDICGLADWAAVEAIVNEQCGWDVE